MNDRLARCFCIDLFHAFITFLIPSLICCATLQVAALQFGDFYNMQYVKMYTIFMMQLQVKNRRKYFFCAINSFASRFHALKFCPLCI
jgi:hypothetical protein